MPAKRSRKKNPLQYVIAAIAVAVVVGIGVYSYQKYQESGIEKEGIVVCSDSGECEKALHIHSALVVSICGEEKDLTKDTGELSDVHTHKQSNVLHLHERLKVTPEGEVLDYTPLKLSNAVEAITGMKLTDQCIGDFCNGAKCQNGQKGELSLVTVNGFCKGESCPGAEEAHKAAVKGERQEEIVDYVWQDGELLYLTFE